MAPMGGYPPPPVGWQTAQVVSEKPETPACRDVMVLFEWHWAQEYVANEDGWHVAHTPPALPWLIGKVCGPLYVAGSQAPVEWQDAHAVPKAPVCDEGLAWQAEQVVGVPL
jgi:hypothetical protein